MSRFKGSSETTRENFGIKYKNFNLAYNFENFSLWLVGFFEVFGELKLISDKDEINFLLSVDLIDIDILYKIKTFLQCGKITTNLNKATYIINNNDQLINIIYPIFNNKILSDSKFNEFKAFCDLFNLPCVKSNNLNSSWLIGFLEANSEFLIINNSAVLKITNNNESLLNLIKINYFKKGKIISNGCNYNLIYQWDDTFRIKKIFILPFLTKKKILFIKWLKILRLIEKKEQLSQDGQLKIQQYQKYQNKI